MLPNNSKSTKIQFFYYKFLLKHCNKSTHNIIQQKPYKTLPIRTCFNEYSKNMNAAWHMKWVFK